jgi:hypothetical protein
MLLEVRDRSVGKFVYRDTQLNVECVGFFSTRYFSPKTINYKAVGLSNEVFRNVILNNFCSINFLLKSV